MPGSRQTALVIACAVTALTACRSVPVPHPVEAAEPARAARPALDHGDFDAFLRRHVDGQGRIDYAAALRDRADLDRYLAAVAATSPDSHPARFPHEPDRLAYWINAYNAWVIAMVLEAWPIESVNDVTNPLRPFHPGIGFFVLRRVTLGGERMSLYTLENGVIRDRFDEPRIHFALNCASLGCPRLPPEAFVPERLEAQLDRETARFLGEERNVRVDLDDRVVWLSAIFDWFEGDFTGWIERHRPGAPADLATWVGLHASPPSSERIAECDDCEIEFAPYDWRLNDRSRPREASLDLSATP